MLFVHYFSYKFLYLHQNVNRLSKDFCLCALRQIFTRFTSVLKNPGKNLHIRELKKTLTLSEEQKEILLGITLGDATIRLKGEVKVEQSIKQYDYVSHLYYIFREFVNNVPKIRTIIGSGKERQSVWFQTFQHPEFQIFRNNFYKHKLDNDGNVLLLNEKTSYVKGIGNLEFLEKYLTPRAIAYWFMDDGSFKLSISKVQGTSKIIAFTLATHGFTQNENIILSNLLLTKYNIYNEVKKDRSHYYIYIFSKSVNDFRNLIKDYVVPSFYYKLNYK